MTDDSRWNVPWVERPPEEARIFNPAFCSELIGRTVGEYYKTSQTPLSVTIAFLVLPLTLHKATRTALPGRANTAFAGWVAENAGVLVLLSERARSLRPVSREAVIFAIRHQLLALESGGLIPGRKPVRANAKLAVTTDEVIAVRNAASLLGRWFAGQGTQNLILQGLGAMP